MPAGVEQRPRTLRELRLCRFDLMPASVESKPSGDRTFIDTNIFFYAEDDDLPAKQTVARHEIRQLATDARGVVSTQVLMEYVAAARKRLGFSLAQCRQGALLIGRFDVALIRSEHVLGALDLASTYSLSHWDALLLKVAASSGCRTLLTEDLQHGQTIDGVTIRNPFPA